jgi:hypothetical protein
MAPTVVGRVSLQIHLGTQNALRGPLSIASALASPVRSVRFNESAAFSGFSDEPQQQPATLLQPPPGDHLREPVMSAEMAERTQRVFDHGRISCLYSPLLATLPPRVDAVPQKRSSLTTAGMEVAEMRRSSLPERSVGRMALGKARTVLRKASDLNHHSAGPDPELELRVLRTVEHQHALRQEERDASFGFTCGPLRPPSAPRRL